MAIAIAVGKYAHTIVGATSSLDEVIPNSIEGVQIVLERETSEVIFVGNRRWILPFASALRGERPTLRLSFRSVEIGHGTRGKHGSIVNVARYLQEKGLLDPQPFFTIKKEGVPLTELHKEALEYLEIVNEVRRYRHSLLDGLYVLFPEIVPERGGSVIGEGPTATKVSNVFNTKKMASVLRDPRPEMVQHDESAPLNVRELAKVSLGNFLSEEDKRENFARYQEALNWYERYGEVKKILIDNLREDTKGSLLVRRFGNSDTVVVLAALIGNEILSDWRRLRAFAGLALTRQEASGKKKISRRNSAVRQYLYLFASLTKEGQEMSREIREAADARAVEAGKEKASHKRIKVLEGVLKRMRREVKALHSG